MISQIGIRQFFKYIFLETCCLLFAQVVMAANGTAVPVECYYDAKSGWNQSAVNIKTAKCNNFELSSLNKNKNHSFSGVCVFKDGMWQRGTLNVYFKGKNANAVNGPTKAFSNQLVCTHGVSVLNQKTNSIEVVGPTRIVAYNRCLGSNFSSLTQKEQAKQATACSKAGELKSLASDFPTFSNNTVLLACIRGESSWGVDRDSVLCDKWPTEKNFCEKVTINANTPLFAAQYKAGYSGDWFVQFRGSGRTKPAICAGGVQVSDIKVAAEEFGDTYSKVYTELIAGTSKVYVSESTIKEITDKSTGLKTAVDAGDIRVIGCISSVDDAYKTCKNGGGGCSALDVDCSKSGYLSKHGLGECYRSAKSGKWSFVTKADKDNRGKESHVCSKIEISNLVREEPDTMQMKQQNFNVQAEVIDDNSNSVTMPAKVSIGNAEAVSDRVLQVVNDKVNEVVGIGGDPFTSGPCPNNSCSTFKISPASQNSSSSTTDGKLWVAKGAKFSDHTLFEKDLVVSGNVDLGGVMKLKSNSSVDLAKSMSLGGSTVGITGSGYISISGKINSGDIVSTGLITANSDARFKTNIKRIPNALEKILNLDGVYYNFDTEKFPERHFSSVARVGLLAQQVREQFPEAVVEASDGFLSVAYGDLVGPIIESIKSLARTAEKNQSLNENSIAETQKQLSDLKRENALLKERLDRLEQSLNDHK